MLTAAWGATGIVRTRSEDSRAENGVSFTPPHLVPMNRSIFDDLCAQPARQNHSRSAAFSLNNTRKEPFVYVLPFGKMRESRHVRGSNVTFIGGVAADRIIVT